MTIVGVTGRDYLDKYGFVNSQGQEVIPCIYDNVNLFADGLAIVSKDGKLGALNKSGKTV